MSSFFELLLLSGSEYHLYTCIGDSEYSEDGSDPEEPSYDIPDKSPCSTRFNLSEIHTRTPRKECGG